GRQRCLRFLFTDRSVAFARAKAAPKISIFRCTIGSEDHARIAHALKEPATGNGLVIRMGNNHQSAAKQRSQFRKIHSVSVQAPSAHDLGALRVYTPLQMSHSSTSTANMKEEIERLFEAGSRAHEVPLAHATFERFREALSHGDIRAAEKRDGQWHVNTWV